MRSNRKFWNMTLGEWLTMWFETYKKPNLKPNSVRNIEQMIRLHTPQWLKDMRMRDISVLDIDKALCLIPRGRTRVYARQVWHSAFLKAERLGFVERNVLALCDGVSYPRRKSKALTIAEQTAFLQAISGTRMQWLMAFYLCTGVRRAEALALEWSDINWEERYILVRGTKTPDSYRMIPLSEDVEYILQGQREQNEADKGTRYEHKDNRIFAYDPSHVSRMFKQLCPSHHLHDLRHTYITRCAESGMNVKVCQQLVGHATSQMTTDVYTHVMDEYKRKEAAKFRLYPDFRA